MSLIVLYSVVALAVMYIALSVILKLNGGHAPDWQARCTACGHTRDAGRAGLIRIGAASMGKVVFGYCGRCKTLRWLSIERKPVISGQSAGITVTR